jgi:hypothetical protein
MNTDKLENVTGLAQTGTVYNLIETGEGAIIDEICVVGSAVSRARTGTTPTRRDWSSVTYKYNISPAVACLRSVAMACRTVSSLRRTIKSLRIWFETGSRKFCSFNRIVIWR